MRCRLFLVLVALAVPVVAAPQSAPRQSNIERFDTSGLPKTASSALEKEIFALLQFHKSGDLRDATRIHLRLAEYYKEMGDKGRADNCAKLANEAWEAADKGVRISAGSPGTPPFEILGVFTRVFAHTDDVGLTHRWEFFDDGTFAHSVTGNASPEAAPPTELGWYSFAAGQIRLWRNDPPLDRTVPLVFQGPFGKNGAIMDGVAMKSVK